MPMDEIKREIADLHTEVKDLAALQNQQALKQQELTSAVSRTNEILTEIRGAFAELAARTATADRVKNLEEKIRGLEAWNQWAARLVFGIVIAALLGLVIVKGGITG